MNNAKPHHPNPNGYGSRCCGRHDVWGQPWGDPSGFCDRGLSGAHLVYKWVYGCELHHQIDGVLGVTGARYCPADCAWSHEEEASVDRSGCRARFCTCHDESAWVPGAYPNGCAVCGCRWAGSRGRRATG